MLQLIKADLYRIFNKKGLYIFSGICTVGFLLVLYLVKTPNFDFNTYTSFVSMVASFICIIIGPFIMGLVYNDDLRSKSLQSAIGFGMKRSQIVITKFIVAMIMYAVICFGFGALILTAPYMFAIPVGNIMQSALLTNFGIEVLRGIVYMAIASIAAFGTQKTTIVTTAYLLIATQTVSGILGLVLGMDFLTNLFGNLSQYLPSNMITRLNMQLLGGPVDIKFPILIAVSVVVSILVSIILFNKKELEF